ncbi:MAG TPA: tetratricopeptide repeat protein [Thermoanaerobaculia bacterium]
MSPHYDEDTLYEYLDDPAGFAGRPTLEAHLAECDPCRRALEELRAFEAALSDDELWELADAARRHSDEPSPMTAFASQLTAEDAEAEAMLAPILGSPAAFRNADVAAAPLMRTSGVVRKLCATSRGLRERQPMHALTLADAAIAISDQLPRDRYPAILVDELRGNAWLERANVLRYLGRYPEALDALDIAQARFEETPVAAFSVALVDFVRAGVFFKSEKLDDAMRLARQSARTFRQFGEEERYVHAKLIQGGVLFHQQQFAEALELFLSLMAVARRLGDAATLARLYSNVANCHLELRELSAASEAFSQALSLYEALGLETERVRTRWSLGRLLLRTGNVNDGIARLRQTKTEFEQLGVSTDAALVTLDLIEALLARGDVRDARALCNGLVKSFSDVGMTSNALTALAFLNDAVVQGSATPELVRHVRTFFEQISGHL